MTAQIKAVEPTTSEKIDQADQAIRMLANDLHRLNQSVAPVSYTHLTLPTKRIV